MDDGPILNVAGELVALGPLHRDQLPAIVGWRNDVEVSRMHADPPLPYTLEQAEQWYEGVAGGGSRDVTFAVYDRASLEIIGVAGLVGIDQRNRTAELELTIGAAAYRGRGYDTAAACLLLDFAFTALGLHNVMLAVASCDTSAIRAYAEAGLREFARRHGSWVIGGARHDRVYLQCLATEHISSVLGRVFAPDEPRRG